MSEQFKEEFELRVDWEIASEYGLTAQLGRTLEKTGASATFFRPEQIEEVYTALRPWMMDNRMEQIAEQREAFCHFVYGILERMRTHGAVSHPYLNKYREEALTQWAMNWNRDGRHFLNKTLGGSMQFPKLVGATIKEKNADMLDMAVLRREGSRNWYSQYFAKQFNDIGITTNAALFNDFMRALLDTMVKAALLDLRPQGGGNYAIRPEAIWVSKGVKHIQCDCCQARLCVAEDDTLAEGTRCLDYKCQGTYSKETRPELNYYRQVYNRTRSPRVYANEHTGLLERTVRERLEQDFKEHPTSGSTNVLVATSTLEMGIDIGDLNVVGNTNVPPRPSNFLQRIGRAGRKEGAALVLNYAHANEPHDMYYFTYPKEMMEGEVTTPGCFLEAKDILRRHFLAFAIDTWTSDNAQHIVPTTVGDMKLTEADVFGRESFFPNQIVRFIKENRERLTTLFRTAYEERTQEALSKMFETLTDGTFYNHIIQAFSKLRERLLHLGKELNQYAEQKAHIQDNDPMLENLNGWIRASKKQKRNIEGESTLEYMTNAGLLPNYAFPETGIRLEATVTPTHEKEDHANKKKEDTTIELVRSASQGIRELAPGNNFYTQKNRLTISGVNTCDWHDELTWMRFCSKCDCLAMEGEEGYDAAACPKCNDPSWGVNKHRTLKFTSARSRMYSREAALNDAKEDRDAETYIVKRHYMFHHNGPTTAYAMRGVGFGIEFCNNMDLYEVNYGMQLQTGAKLEVNEDGTVPQNGFVTCRHCGKSTPLLAGVTEAKDFHYPFCNHRTVSFADDVRGEVFEPLYLYRHMQTEAIKILLPVQIMDAQATVEMFKAGITLGLKAYYKSTPEHIRIDAYSEMNQATMTKDHYLVMYDIIPGGTGYLAKLYNPEAFTKVLQAAYESIRDCDCQLEGKDGCYHCILTYGNQYKREAFSREMAEELFEQLNKHARSWERIAGTVGTVAQSGVVEDSELEVKFEKALDVIARQEHWTFVEDASVDEKSFKLHIVDEQMDTDIMYSVIPQFTLGQPYGVQMHTIADFLIICIAAKIEGKTIAQPECLPMWAIYLDGYSYHAKAPNIRFYGDKEKRDAIRASAIHKFYTWTMTWTDVQLFEKGEEDSLGLNSVRRLVELLRNPLQGHILETVFGCIADADGFMAHGGSLYKGSITIDESGYNLLTDNSTDEEVAAALRNAIRYEWNLQMGLTAIDHDAWDGFWRRYNLLQFFPCEEEVTAVAAVPEEKEVDRDEIKGYYPGLESIVDQLLDHDIAFSHDGDVDLTDGEGIVVASAQMILEGQKVAIDPVDETSSRTFISRGYKVITAAEFNINNIIH